MVVFDSVRRLAIVLRMLFKGIYSNGFYGIYSFFAFFGAYFDGVYFDWAFDASTTGCSLFFGWKLYTSCFIIRPFGPDPETYDRFTPFCWAIDLARGLAITRSPEDVDWTFDCFCPYDCWDCDWFCDWDLGWD